MPRFATQSWSVRRALAAREPFNTYGAFRATNERSYCVGLLPEPWADRYRAEADAGRIVYQVYSYSTPIAWVLDDDTVVIPHVRYSPTTTSHQGLLYALDKAPDTFPQDASCEPAVAFTQAPGSWDWPRADRHPAGGEGRNGRGWVSRLDRSQKPARVDFAPVRMEYSESYSVRQGWATSYDAGPASGVKQSA
ncbi:hypothetical protein [Streptomyces phaeochromogenes]|uniref:hypothetical protein n=1 Tax=Streptomyces phaeochromogenes TaxID=1923 RepID=UPI00386B7BF7|nr:hypothetical protein OG277_38390 [Streptomyces phaeochromogenes]